MKLATISRGVETSVSSSTTMSIENSAHMFNLLSDKLYSDKPRAVLREIGCNALDACGQLKLTMPTRFDPTLTFRDFGPGMSHEFMMGGYTKVGHSTKTDSNDVVGGFGIGRMAVFAYTDAYTVTSITNLKRVYAVFRGDNGLPQVTLVDTSITDEPTGVEVKVPVQARDVYSFEHTAKDVFRWFPPGSVEGFDQIQPKIAGDGWIMIADPGQTYVKMGPVAYQVDWRQVGVSLPSTIVPVFEIGEIGIAPNRESLSYDRNTLAVLKDRVTQIRTSFAARIQEQAEVLNPVERIRLIASLSGLYELFRPLRNQEGFGQYMPAHLERIRLSAPVTFYGSSGHRASTYLNRIPSSFATYDITQKAQLDYNYVWRDDPDLNRIFDRFEAAARTGAPWVLVSPSTLIPDIEALRALLPGITIRLLSELPAPYKERTIRGPARVFVWRSGYWEIGETTDDTGIYVPFTIAKPDPMESMGAYLRLARDHTVYGLTQTALKALDGNFVRLDDWAKQRAAEVKADPSIAQAWSAQELLRTLQQDFAIARFLRHHTVPVLQEAKDVLSQLYRDAAVISTADLQILMDLKMLEPPKVVDTYKAVKLFERVTRRNPVFDTMLQLKEHKDVDIREFAR